MKLRDSAAWIQQRQVWEMVTINLVANLDVDYDHDDSTGKTLLCVDTSHPQTPMVCKTTIVLRK